MLNQKSNHQSKLHYALVSESGQRLQFFETTKGAGFDLNLFSIEDMQHVLISRIQCLQAGFPANHFIITTLDEIRNQFVEQFGVGAYFNQMRRVISKTNRQNSERPAKHEATVPRIRHKNGPRVQPPYSNTKTLIFLILKRCSRD